MTRFLLVPGRGIPRPDHWLRRWSAAHPEYVWAPEPPGPPIILEDRVAALDEALRASDEPAVLIAHSAGCIATVEWASRHTGPVHAALLVTPPYVEGPPPPGTDDHVRWIVPRQRLPFRTIVVASRNDPHCPYAESERYASAWGADLIDAGNAGHLDTSSGYGPWPAGETLLQRLT